MSGFRCIIEHGDYGGSPCDGGEAEEEECFHDTDNCKACYWTNSTGYTFTFKENDVVYSDECYNYICISNDTQKVQSYLK